MRYLALAIFLSFLTISLSWAESRPKDVRYSIAGDSLDTIASRYLPDVNIKYSGRIEDYKADLIKWNPHVKNWNELSARTPLYIDYPYVYFVSHDYAEPLKMGDYSFWDDSQFKSSFFYTASLGLFSETTSQEQSINSTQNSPVSIGLGTSYKIPTNQQHLVASAYWSKLIASKIEGNVANANAKISIPNEVGINLYYQHTFKNTQWSLYGGSDYESFATYNTSELELGSALQTRTNNLTYATAGLMKVFPLKSSSLVTKVSWAKSILSKSSTGLESNEFSGSRALFFMSLSNQTPFTYHLLFKRHMLTGPTKLSINRLGIGAGYSF